MQALGDWGSFVLGFGIVDFGLRPLRAVGSIYEPEAVGAIRAYPPACKPMAYKPTGWPLSELYALQGYHMLYEQEAGS